MQVLQETSQQALRSQESKAPADRLKILGCIATSPFQGFTCDEVESVLKMSHQTASARIRDLATQGLVVDSRKRRNTRTGRPAIVWRTPAPEVPV